MLVRAGGAPRTIIAESRRDVKLGADAEAEGLIIEDLRSSTDLPILSEERGSVGGSGRGDGLRWIVDPLDGSVNYLMGIPLSAVSIGLWHDDQPVLGAIYDFWRDDMYTGILGSGAWLNDVPIRASETAEVGRAVLCTGFPAGTDFSSDAVGQFVRDVQQYRKIRLLGSAALSLAFVAAGRVDAYFERDIKLWDVAAGIAIACSAGSRIERAVSRHPQSLTVYVANVHLSRLWRKTHPSIPG